jgi:hypothetical protein
MWTRSTDVFFPKCQQLVLMSHAKKTKCLFILCYQMTTGLGALGKQGESSSHEKPCRASPTLGVFPLTPRGALSRMHYRKRGLCHAPRTHGKGQNPHDTASMRILLRRMAKGTRRIFAR